MSLALQKVILSITPACNFKCKFCFPSHDHCGSLSFEEQKELIKKLSASGMKEITFVGGEPTLCPELPQLIMYAKRLGAITKLVTNGTGLSEAFLADMAGYLDCITISVDSVNENALRDIGRQANNMIINKEFYYNLISNIRKHNYRLKINTVVSSLNINEDLSDFINYAAPSKWKLFQVLTFELKALRFAISNKDFAAYCKSQKEKTAPETQIVVAPSEFIKGSCTMIDHTGRFFDIVDGSYNYSEPILEVGVDAAFNQVTVIEAKFLRKMQLAS